ncbi:MAG: uracil-DNA glycosylase family protein [Flavobacteriaceae bacterium]
MKTLLQDIKNCTVCEASLEYGVNPVISASKKSKIVIIGQAPGRIVHETGIPWNDKSGENLRAWLGVEKESFYNPELFAIIPMGFCYPGKGRSGDLPPRKECAPLWHTSLLNEMEDVRLVLLIGKYAQEYYLQETVKRTLTETVKNYKLYLPKYFVLPHPSPRNNIWQSKNDWFAKEVLPSLKTTVEKVLQENTNF